MVKYTKEMQLNQTLMNKWLHRKKKFILLMEYIHNIYIIAHFKNQNKNAIYMNSNNLCIAFN